MKLNGTKECVKCVSSRWLGFDTAELWLIDMALRSLDVQGHAQQVSRERCNRMSDEIELYRRHWRERERVSMTTEYVEVEIEITRELAMRGTRSVCEQCPVALAINEKLIPGWIAHIERDKFAIFDSSGVGPEFEFPVPAREFIQRYDKHLPIDFPVKFKLSLPKHALKEDV